MLTACVVAQDSIKFSAAETKVLLTHHLNYPKLQKIADSCDAQEQQFRNTIKNDNKMLAECQDLLLIKEQTIQKTEAQVIEKREALKKNLFWKKFWKRCSCILAGLSIIEGATIYILK